MGLANKIFQTATGGGFFGAGSGGDSSSRRGQDSGSQDRGLINQSVEGATGWVEDTNPLKAAESTVSTVAGGVAAGGFVAAVVAFWRRR